MTGGQKLRNVCMIEVGRCGRKMFQLLCENHSTVTRASWLISSQIIQLTLWGLIHDPDILDKSKKE